MLNDFNTFISTLSFKSQITSRVFDGKVVLEMVDVRTSYDHVFM